MPVPSNTWQDASAGWAVPSAGTVINTGGYTTASGGTYGDLASIAHADVVVETVSSTASPFASTSGTSSYALYSTALAKNDPVQMVFVYNGSPTHGVMGLLQRIQSNGSGYKAAFNATNSAMLLQTISSGGSLATVGASVTVTGLASGVTYTWTYCPWYTLHELYLTRSTDGFYFNGANWVAAKRPVLAVTDQTTTGAGQAGFEIGAASGDANAPQIISVQGGPALLMPPELAIKQTSDTMVVFGSLSSQGGTGTKTYTLQRGTSSSGPFSNVTATTPGQAGIVAGLDFWDATVAVSTTYYYRLRCADSNGVTSYSTVISATTLAAISWSPPSLTAPSSPLTTWTSGILPPDVNGNPIILRAWSITYEPRSNLYYLVGASFVVISSTPYGGYNDIWMYASPDAMNWTPVGSLGIGGNGGAGSGKPEVNGTAYNSMGYPDLWAHPTDGSFLLFFAAVDSAGTDNYFFSYRSTTGPAGTYGYVGGPFQASGYTGGKMDLGGTFKEYDGTFWVYVSYQNVSMQGAIQEWNAGLASLASAVYSPDVSGFAHEGLAPWRSDRFVYVHCSFETGYSWNANECEVRAGSSSLTTYTIPSTSIYTTATELVATPAGTGGSLPGGDHGGPFPNGYNVTTTGSPPRYSSGAGIGIDPAVAYSTQAYRVMVTATGQVIALTNRFDATGTTASVPYALVICGNGGAGTTPLSSPGQVTIPFAANFVPQAGPITLTGPSTATVGTPITLTFTPFGPITDTASPVLSGVTGNFGSAPTWVFSSSAKTVSFTPTSAGTATIGATSNQGYPIVSLTVTVSSGGGSAGGGIGLESGGAIKLESGTLLLEE